MVTFEKDFIVVGYLLDPETDGLLFHVAPNAEQNAQTIIKGKLTNYDPATKTLHKCDIRFFSANGGTATLQVLGTDLDIVTSEALLNVFGADSGFRDRDGNDALRNLSRSARFITGERDFTTAGSFTSTSRLSVFGDSRFTVQGDLKTRGGFFEISALTASGLLEQPYLSSEVTVNGDLRLPPRTQLLFDLHDMDTPLRVEVSGRAALNGRLAVVLDGMAQIHESDSFTVLTASEIKGRFSNVASGGRVNAFSDIDLLGHPLGGPVGSFLVTYDHTTLVSSDFQANAGATFQAPTKVFYGEE